jgi:hypothetical protein
MTLHDEHKSANAKREIDRIAVIFDPSGGSE